MLQTQMFLPTPPPTEVGDKDVCCIVLAPRLSYSQGDGGSHEAELGLGLGDGGVVVGGGVVLLIEYVQRSISNQTYNNKDHAGPLEPG